MTLVRNKELLLNMFKFLKNCTFFRSRKELETIKTNYFYVDESGNILNDSNLFIHGCIKTDTPQLLAKVLEEIKLEINNDFYFNEFLNEFNVAGFHAVDNHFDIRAILYRKLINLNWRAYFVIVNKRSEFYDTIKSKKEYEIFIISLSKLIFNRVRKDADAKNIFIFETIQLSEKSLDNVLRDFFNSLNQKYNCEYRIVNKKDEINLGIIDYLNYMLNKILTTNNSDIRMRQNFDIFAPKIALIHIQKYQYIFKSVKG